MNEETLKEQVYREQKEIAGMRQVNKFWENYSGVLKEAAVRIASTNQDQAGEPGD